MLSDALREKSVNYSRETKRSCDYGTVITTMLKTSMYKTAPFVIKPQYAYSSADIDAMAKAEEVWNVYNDLPFYQMLTESGLAVDEDCRAAFRFFHMVGAHAPFCLSEDLKYDKSGREGSLLGQARGSLKIVFEYLEQLKALGRYDSATIIITTDHGQVAQSNPETGKMEILSSPLMLVKEAGCRQDTMAISTAPVAQSELMPAIMKAAGLDWKEYGRTFAEIGENEARERTYNDVYFRKEGNEYTDYFIEYLIDGNVKDINSWRVNQVVYY
ncbi:MAG: hypothetical protein NC337_11500 [Roseburia sp.]|nr:hypothetical protein [Roseburia sp.]